MSVGSCLTMKYKPKSEFTYSPSANIAKIVGLLLKMNVYLHSINRDCKWMSYICICLYYVISKMATKQRVNLTVKKETLRILSEIDR